MQSDKPFFVLSSGSLSVPLSSSEHQKRKNNKKKKARYMEYMN